MKIRSVFLSAFAMFAMGAVCISAQAETTQSADQMEEVLDHLGLFVEDLEFSEGEAFSILGRDRDRDRANGGGNRGGNRDRANRGGGNRNRDRAGRGGGNRNRDRGGRHGRGDWRDRDNDGRMDRRHGNRGGHRDRDRRWRNDDDDDGRYWRRYPRTPRYPIPPAPRVRCMAYGYQTNKLYPVLGRTPSVVQEAAMDYCYRYNRRCEERGCSYE